MPPTMWAGTESPEDRMNAALSAVIPAACSVVEKDVVCPKEDEGTSELGEKATVAERASDAAET
jgi:hypothetical protein